MPQTEKEEYRDRRDTLAIGEAPPTELWRCKRG